MSETTKEYFEREKESRFDLMDYIDSEQGIERVEIVDKLIGEGQIDDLLEWTEEDGETVLDVDETNRAEIEERRYNDLCYESKGEYYTYSSYMDEHPELEHKDAYIKLKYRLCYLRDKDLIPNVI